MTKDPRFTKSANSVTHSLLTQIPSFYNDEGEGFVNFINAYYEFMEDNFLGSTRNLQNAGDIDTTDEDNLIRFNNKFTFGASRAIRTLPSVITGDLRFVIKHIKDLYRSKGTTRGTKLFFRLAFNDEPEIFTPGEYLFTTSGSTFHRPDIIEVGKIFLTEDDVDAFLGQKIVGNKTGATAIVANIFRKKVQNKEFTYFELDRVNGTFLSGDKIHLEGATDATISGSLEVTGPVREVEIIDGSVRIPEGTEFTAKPSASGVELKVSATDFEFLLGTFDPNPITGTLYSANSVVTVTRAPGETDTLERGSYRVAITNPSVTETIDGELIQTYASETIGNTVIYGTVLDSSNVLSAYAQTAIEDILQYDTRVYGDISRLVPISTPSGYTGKPFVRVEDVIFTKNLVGTVAISNSLVTGTGTLFDSYLLAMGTRSGNVDVIFGSTDITGYGTTFQTDFEPNDTIRVADNDGLPLYATIDSITNNTFMTAKDTHSGTSLGAEYGKGHQNYIKMVDSAGTEVIRVVNTHVSNTSLYLDDAVLSGEIAETANLTYYIGYPTGDVTFSEDTEPLLYNLGEDADFEISVISDAGSVKGVQILNSGFGYDPRNQITMVSEDLTPQISITGGDGSGAKAFAELSAGTISKITITDPGSGYTSAPTITFFGGTGSGAAATATIEGGSVVSITVTNAGSNYESKASIVIKPIKSGQSILEGTTTNMSSETSAHLRVQDSNYWQEYSYEIGSSIDSSRYEDIVRDLVHIAGRRFFTKGLVKDDVDSRRVISDTVTSSI